MGPERKDERKQPGAEQERGAPREAADPREEEGYSQPESSAQKTPRPEDEDTVAYLRDLRAALEQARRRGARLAADAWVLETVPR